MMDNVKWKIIGRISYSDLINSLMVLTGVLSLIFPFAEVNISSYGGVSTFFYSVFLYKISEGNVKLIEISSILFFFYFLFFVFSALNLFLRGIGYRYGFLQGFLLSVSVISFALNFYLVSSNIKSLYYEPWYLNPNELQQFQQFYSVSTSFGVSYYFTWLTVFTIVFAPFRHRFLNLIEYIQLYISRTSEESNVSN